MALGVWVLTELAGSFAVGWVLGLVARWLGFGSVETFFAYRGAFNACSCLGLIAMILLITLSGRLATSLPAITALTVAALALLFWGFLHGLVANPRGWLAGRDDEGEPPPV